MKKITVFRMVFEHRESRPTSSKGRVECLGPDIRRYYADKKKEREIVDLLRNSHGLKEISYVEEQSHIKEC